MKETLDKDFAKFVERNPEVLGMLNNGRATTNLSSLWVVLVYIFDFNCLYVYEQDKNGGFSQSLGLKRDLLGTEPIYKNYFWLMKSAFEEDEAKSTQEEEGLKDNMVFVQAIAAVPLVIDNAKKVVVFCKQLIKPQSEVVEGYVFNGYEIERFMSIIKIVMRVQGLEKQLVKNKRQISIGKLAVVVGGVLALLQGLDSVIGIIKDFSIWHVAEGLIAIILLAILGFAITRFWKTEMPFKIYEKL